MQFGMIAYCVPLSRYPETYNGAPLLYAALAAQKNHNAVYLMGIYADGELRKWFEANYKASGKRLDVGKSCVRFKTLDDLPLHADRRSDREDAAGNVHRAVRRRARQARASGLDVVASGKPSSRRPRG